MMKYLIYFLTLALIYSMWISNLPDEKFPSHKPSLNKTSLRGGNAEEVLVWFNLDNV